MKTNLIPSLLAAVALGLPSFALAAVPSEPPPVQSCAAPVVLAAAKSAGLAPGTRVVSAACKPWPAQRHTILAAFAFDLGTADQKTLVVATFDAATQRVTRTFRIEVTEDAVTEFGEGSLWIDTAPYRLTDRLTAFGVRFGSVALGASCGEGNWGDELTLFVPEGDALRPVLQGLAMAHSQALQGCFGPGNNGDLVYDEAVLSIALANTQSNGLRDLLVTARLYRNGRQDPKQKPSSIERQVLRYDGRHYRENAPTPWWLSIFRPGE